jgi:hypothetical protein
MSDPLATYLHDHLAGSHFAIKLLESLHDQYGDEPLGQFALRLKADVTQDQETLQRICDQVGKSQFDLAEAAGWFAEKASKFKLQRDDSSGGLGTFEALETLALGILGKLSLWHVLPVIREVDARITDNEYHKLALRAEEQYKRVEALRLMMARTTFRAVFEQPLK